jgi:hypothetical protein
LSLALVNIQPKLRDQRPADTELGDGEHRYGELAQAEQADAELRYIENAGAELADGDHASGRHRHPVRAVLERDVQQRQAEQFGFLFVFVAPAIPLFLCGVWRTAAGADNRLLTDRVAAFSARFHGCWPVGCVARRATDPGTR